MPTLNIPKEEAHHTKLRGAFIYSHRVNLGGNWSLDTRYTYLACRLTQHLAHKVKESTDIT